jgi:hypothetical protein
MSLSTRLDKLEAAMRGRDGGDPPDVPWICCRLIYDPREWVSVEDEAGSRLKGELREIDRERISRMKTGELDRLVAAGTIREIDREHVRFIVPAVSCRDSPFVLFGHHGRALHRRIIKLRSRTEFTITPHLF